MCNLNFLSLYLICNFCYFNEKKLVGCKIFMMVSIIRSYRYKEAVVNRSSGIRMTTLLSRDLLFSVCKFFVFDFSRNIEVS